MIVVWRWLPGHLPARVPYAAALATGAGWEVVEHTDWVLNRFRETAYKDYRGDTVVNSVADYVWMLAGFYLAELAPVSTGRSGIAMEA